jgi:hypothetical protein
MIQPRRLFSLLMSATLIASPLVTLGADAPRAASRAKAVSAAAARSPGGGASGLAGSPVAAQPAAASRSTVGATATGSSLHARRAVTPEGSEPANVAANDTQYQLCGRVFPDPHAYWPSPTQTPTRSPWAKGNAACASADFITYHDMVDGMTYLEGLFPKFVKFYELDRDFGTSWIDCQLESRPFAYCSAGLPRQGVSNGRLRSDLYMVRLTDERVPDAGKKYFVFPLSIHGIERAGAEAGVRAAEDLATWGFCSAVAQGTLPPKAVVDCDKEGDRPYKLLEAQPDQSINAAAALRDSVIYFVFPNPDGWRRGETDNLARFYQRYNGNGVDLNRDWPTQGYTYRPYTPWSEPETRAFGKVLKQIKPNWDAGIDLHGQLIDRAFSFTLMGASERDFGKNQRILQSVKGAWGDAEQRLAWSPVIKPNDAPDQCSATLDPPDCDERMWGVQWGTVWDTINYTVTGSVGDWIDSPIGLNADGIDNEMSFSHLSNCGIGSCYEPQFEQLHVDGNKSLIYAMVNFTLLPEDQRFRVPGDVGYVFDPTVLSHPGSPASVNDKWSHLPHQPAMLNRQLTADNDWTYAFDVLGPADGYYNGGLQGNATMPNVQGISPSSVTELVLERRNPEEPSPQESGCDGSLDWTEVNRYYNQSPLYVQGGQAVHANLVKRGRYRICLAGDPVEDGTLAEVGAVVDLDIRFSSEKVWADPGQRPYEATNMDFFRDLSPHMRPGQLARLRAGRIIDGTTDLDDQTSVVIADDALPIDGASNAQKQAWGNRLRDFVEDGGNLVLTDGALRTLGIMGALSDAAIHESFAYAGYIGFTADGGSTSTYEDPLATDVDQPGAAEGTSHRHQTYEPVPIGFEIEDRQSCSGAQCTSPIWYVDQAAWQGAGGRTVGTSGTNRVTLGELPLGDGVVRIIGALLPMPSDDYYHPFGLANYAVTYSGYQVLDNAMTWQRPQ